MDETKPTTGQATVFIEAGAPLQLWPVQFLPECDFDGLLCIEADAPLGIGQKVFASIHVSAHNTWPGPAGLRHGVVTVQGKGNAPESRRRAAIHVLGKGHVIGWFPPPSFPRIGAVHVSAKRRIPPPPPPPMGFGVIHVGCTGSEFFRYFFPSASPIIISEKATVVPPTGHRGRGPAGGGYGGGIFPDFSDMKGIGVIRVNATGHVVCRLTLHGVGVVHVACVAKIVPPKAWSGTGIVHVSGAGNASYSTGDVPVTPGSSCAGAATIVVGTSYTFAITDPATHWFKFPMTGGTTYHVHFHVNSGSVGTCVFRQGDACDSWNGETTITGPDGCDTMTHLFDTNGYVQVNSAFFSSGNYTITAGTGLC